MCQCQLSSVELASGAAIPPCAATVCERVGNTLESTATRKSARASSSAARIPEPPGPHEKGARLRDNGPSTWRCQPRTAHAGPPRADDDGVELADHRHRIWMVQLA